MDHLCATLEESRGQLGPLVWTSGQLGRFRGQKACADGFRRGRAGLLMPNNKGPQQAVVEGFRRGRAGFLVLPWWRGSKTSQHLKKASTGALLQFCGELGAGLSTGEGSNGRLGTASAGEGLGFWCCLGGGAARLLNVSKELPPALCCDLAVGLGGGILDGGGPQRTVGDGFRRGRAGFLVLP